MILWDLLRKILSKEFRGNLGIRVGMEDDGRGTGWDFDLDFRECEWGGTAIP